MKLTPEQITQLKTPLPTDAIKPHPTKPYLSTIKVPYIVERLNEVFGIGGWSVENRFVERTDFREITKYDTQGNAKKTNLFPMVVVESIFTAPEYGIRIPMFGGNDNEDLGDAYKGACTDALSKIGSYLYIGMDVYKGHGNGNGNHTPAPQSAQQTQPVQQKPSPQQLAQPVTNNNGTHNGDPVADILISAVEDGEKKFSVTIGGKVAGTKYLGCFEKKLFNAFVTHQGSTARVAYRTRDYNGKTYANITDLLSIDGTEYHEGVPVIRNDNVHGVEIDSSDIPF